MKRYEAFITKNWRATGLVNVAVARIDDNGNAILGSFLVDYFCLGVKDAFFLDDLTEGELREIIEERFPDGEMERMHPAWAKKLIEGAVAYAEGLGFAPHRDYRKARRALNGIDTDVCTETFVYGDKGRPHFVQGHMDDDERAARVHAILEARLGPDGYYFTSCAEMPGDFDPDDDSDLSDADEPDISDEGLEQTRKLVASALENMKGDCTVPIIAGSITAMLCHPDLFTVDDMLEEFREDKDLDGNPFKADDIAALGIVLETYWAQLEALLEFEMDTDSPWPFDIYMHDFPDVKEHFQAMLEWVHGFMSIVDVYENLWIMVRERPGLADHWELLERWGDPTAPGGLFEELMEREAKIKAGEIKPDDPLDKDDIDNRTNLREAVTAIYRALREEGDADADGEAEAAED
jgi:hypothetical protein